MYRSRKVPGGSRTRLSGVGSRCLGRSATDTSRSAEGEGVEPSRLVAHPGLSRVPSPVGLPFRWQSGWLDLNQRSPAPEAGGLNQLSYIQIVSQWDPRDSNPHHAG